MIFRRLTLNNFRQFVGTHTISFATDIDKNVTVIHGDNGAGKTTLLNAFTWLLYQETTPDFQVPDRLGSDPAFGELAPQGSFDVSVELEFEDSGLIYTVRRSTTVSKDLENKRVELPQTSLRIYFIDESGETQEPRNAPLYIEHLLPKPLYPFFFFNGERIEQLASPSAYDEVENGVKVLMDIELFDRAILHLDNGIAKRLRDEIARHSGEEGKELKSERDKLEEEQTKRTAEIAQKRDNQKEYLKEKDKIDQKLSLMPEVARQHAERKAAEEALETKRQQLRSAISELTKLVSRDGYLVLAPNVLTQAEKKLSAAHKSGDLPVKIKRQFVDELLSRNKCICDRPLEHGTPEHECVVGWRNRAMSDELDSAVTVTKSEIEPLLNRRHRSMAEMDRLQQERTQIKKAIRELEEKLDQLSKDIDKNNNIEDQERLEIRRRQIEEHLRTLEFDFKEADRQAEQTSERLRDLDTRLKKLEKTDEQAKLAERRLTAVQNISSALKRIREFRHENLREDLSKRLNDVWSQIALKDYYCDLDKQYHLSLSKQVGGETVSVLGTGTGEKQILSLAFVGALVEKAKSTFEQYRDEPQRMFKGGMYSIVMDSPFGSLGPDYRRGVAAAIPKLSPQVIVFVSETQWRGEFEQEVASRVGKEYVLCLHTTKKLERRLRINNRDYEYVTQSADGTEHTKIVEVEYGRR